MQTLIENVSIINPFEEIKSGQNVLIEDNRIKEISSAKINTKNQVNIIDGQDNYLLSGFIDCHCHIFAKAFTKRKTWQILWEFISTMRFLMHHKQSMRV